MALNISKRYSLWIVLLVSGMLTFGCAGISGNKNDLHRLSDVRALPKDARIGLTAFTSCGGSYLDKLDPKKYKEDAKAVFYLACTDLGYPQIFSKRLQQRLEERLGRKLVTVKENKPFKPKQVLHQADKLGLEYVIAGDLLYMGAKENKAIVSSLFYLIRVIDAKIVVVGRVHKSGPIRRSQKVIDDVADELFARSFEE